jgi:hypothetical protein
MSLFTPGNAQGNSPADQRNALSSSLGRLALQIGGLIAGDVVSGPGLAYVATRANLTANTAKELHQRENRQELNSSDSAPRLRR